VSRPRVDKSFFQRASLTWIKYAKGHRFDNWTETWSNSSEYLPRTRGFQVMSSGGSTSLNTFLPNRKILENRKLHYQPKTIAWLTCNLPLEGERGREGEGETESQTDRQTVTRRYLNECMGNTMFAGLKGSNGRFRPWGRMLPASSLGGTSSFHTRLLGPAERLVNPGLMEAQSSGLTGWLMTPPPQPQTWNFIFKRQFHNNRKTNLIIENKCILNLSL
jgi:hypothetical protein